MARLDPESVDLADLATVLQSKLGRVVDGDVVALTRMRDVVADHLECSALEAELLVDTMAGRGFVRRETGPTGAIGWVIGS